MNIENIDKEHDDIIITDNSVTFDVDGQLPFTIDKDDDLEAYTPSELVKSILHANDKMSEDHIFSSFEDKEYCYLNLDPFFTSFITAYAEHRPLILSPDMIWLKILQELSLYVNNNPEKFRHLLVDFEGRIALVINVIKDLEDPEFDWESLLNTLISKVNTETKDNIIKDLSADFSTTTSVERMAQQITLTNVVKSYFKIYVRRYVCGIPYITLKGRPEDWKAILDKLDTLSKFGLEWWVQILKPIIRQFIKASKGKPNVKFWKTIVNKKRVDFINRGCLTSYVNGWFLKLFPFDYDELKKSFPCAGHMKTEMFCLPFTFVIENEKIAVMREAEFWAGFIGVDMDPVSHSLEPKIGWFVRYKEDPDDLAREYMKQAEHSYKGRPRLELEIDEVPEFLKYIPEFTELSLNFTGEVNIPEWMDGKIIDRFTVRGKFRRGDKGRLRKRFSKIVLIDPIH